MPASAPVSPMTGIFTTVAPPRQNRCAPVAAGPRTRPKSTAEADPSLRGRNAWPPRGVLVSPTGDPTMLWTIAVILLVLWLPGFFAFQVAGGIIHLLLVLAFVVVFWQFTSGGRTCVFGFSAVAAGRGRSPLPPPPIHYRDVEGRSKGTRSVGQ